MSYIDHGPPYPGDRPGLRGTFSERFGIGTILIWLLVMMVFAWLATLSLHEDVGSMLELSEIGP